MASDPPSTLTSLRAMPVQARARKTVEVLLAAARELLIEGGPEALTTSGLAARTGLHVRNVYRYFPNRNAVFAALAEQFNQRLETELSALSGLLNPTADWRAEVQKAIGVLLMVGAHEPAIRQIRAALQTSPELQAMEVASDKRIATLIAQALHVRGAPASLETLEVRAFVLVSALGAVLDRMLLCDGDQQRLMLEEIESMAETYLAKSIARGPSTLG